MTVKQFVLFSSILIVILAKCKANDFIEFVPLDAAKDWWETASFYQIYPRSFKDTNGDGIGDLNGITEQLEYLHNIGITATWLSPIFKSPMADFGYDISDYFDIQPEYGTLSDFDRLVEKATKLNIKIILDFVPNHSSDENEWFQKSVNRHPDYEDFYIWHPGKADANNASRRIPPSNWISVFRKSAWQWNEKRAEFYFHQFLVKQPDLNYRNPKVVEKMKSVMRFWLKRGVSGFRIDAVPHLFEINKDANGNYEDEPLSGGSNDPDDYGYLNHIYTYDQPETIDMVYQWRKILDDFKKENGGDTRIMLTEAYSSMNVIREYFGNETHNGSHIPFNFQLLSVQNNSNAVDYVYVIDYWVKNIPEGRTSNWVTGNHDVSRIGSRVGTDRIDIMNMILLTLPGASVSYNGEEIGMTDEWISWKDTVDPAACNSNPQIYEHYTRDPERTPFQWNNELNAGFSTAKKTWLPVSDTYKEVNVRKENSTTKSYLQTYMQLQSLRKTYLLQYGDLQYEAINNKVLVIKRSMNNLGNLYIIVVNVGDNNEAVNLNDLKWKIPEYLTFVIVSTSSSHIVGDDVSIKNLHLQPKECFVLEAKENTVDHYY